MIQRRRGKSRIITIGDTTGPRHLEVPCRGMRRCLFWFVHINSEIGVRMRTRLPYRSIGSEVAAALILILLSSCQILGQGDTNISGNALVLPSCGPTDGPATEIYLSEDLLQCDRVPVMWFEEPQQQTFIRIILLGFRPPTGGTFTLGHDPEYAGFRGGTAYSCAQGGGCEQTCQGTVTFGEPTEEGRIPLQVHLQFEGEQVAGTYEAALCEQKYLCG